MHSTLPRTGILVLGLVIGLALAGCESGPQKTLSQAAKALDDKDSAAFLARFDMKAFAAHEMMNLREDSDLFSGLDAIGGFLGITPEVDRVVRDVMNLENTLTRTFTRTAGSGELVNQCSRATTPDCPWVPSALRKAQVRELDQQAAIARVTTPASMTSWIALRRDGEEWRVVGKAILEETAEHYARDETPLPEREGRTNSPRPGAPGR